MICSHCHSNFKATAVKAQRGKGFEAQIQCPHCDAWLGRSPLLAKLKLLGFYLGVAAVLTAWLHAPWRGLAMLAAGFCLTLLLVSHLMDQLVVIEAPEVEDKSHERQKYR
ncbi:MULTISPECIES: hypothetical protein [Shewanella]|jgi:hypothetical protein|uniref:Uncharacterized protein n=2 Tax=Shewanella TaxID=22 RepID=A0AAJ1BDN8_9GAMM|nr:MULTISPECIES: hypothetical protein [Shewanella]AZQ09177.1 hypothetical protein STH12_00024 [Shewanella khirikhana]MCH4292872.1 hypothetical protein [Shewanella zhuhaiensis]